MDIKAGLWFYKKFKADNLCLLYNGSFIDEITDRFVHISEFNINNYEEFKKVKKRISFLLIECFQNIVRHRERTNKIENMYNDLGFFATRNFKGTYQIVSGNLIENKKINDLQEQLKKINSLSLDELKEFHREVMQTKTISEKGGAGLGLIEIARKSGQKVDFVFEAYKDDLSFYYNQVNLKSKNPEFSENNSHFIPIEDSIDFHKKMLKEKILVIQKGDFSHNSILPILNIIETNLKEEFKESFTKKQIYHILVELLQNINKHCMRVEGIKEGILAIGKTEGRFAIMAGNYIEKEKIPEFEKHLQMIKSKTIDELTSIYKKILLDANLYGENGGIGLIDIARSISSPLLYDFSEIEPGNYFYSINVTV